MKLPVKVLIMATLCCVLPPGVVISSASTLNRDQTAILHSDSRTALANDQSESVQDLIVADAVRLSRSWLVRADGSGDMPTIQAAIDAASPRDTVLLDQGIFTGAGNRDLSLAGKDLVLMSLSGPEYTEIDCQGLESDNHRALTIGAGVTQACMVEGITFRHAYTNFLDLGGAIVCSSSAPMIRNCRFFDNFATGGSNGGGAIYAEGAGPSIDSTVFAGNGAPHGLGGAIISISSTVSLVNCTFVNNFAWYGDALGSSGSSTIEAEKCLVTFNGKMGWGTYQGPVVCMSGSAAFSCCDVYGNQAGDWIGCIAGQETGDYNFSEHPMYCDSSSRDYHLDGQSPAAPGNSPCGAGVGALGVACGSYDPGIPDTLRIGCPINVPAAEGDSLALPIYAWHDEELAAFVLPLYFNSDYIEPSSISMAGSVLDSASWSAMPPIPMGIQHQTFVGWVAILADWFEPPTPADTASLVATLYFRMLPGVGESVIDFDTLFYPPAADFKIAVDTNLGPETAPIIQIRPRFGDCGTEDVILSELQPGDVDHSGRINISDAVYIVGYIFGANPPPNPPDVADVDCSGAVNISDVVYIVAYIFGGGPAPGAGCP